jgi:hypothetical protein
VGPRASLVRCGISRLHWDSIPGPSSPYAVATQTALLLPARSKELLHVTCTVQLGCTLLKERRTASTVREKVTVQGKYLNRLTGVLNNIRVKH